MDDAPGRKRIRPLSTTHARTLRRKMTDAERRLWYKLRNRRFAKFKFRRQVAIGDYIVDFVCQRTKLVLELDGGQHKSQKEYDEERTRFLELEGFRVVRFWNHDLFLESDAVEELIWRRLQDS